METKPIFNYACQNSIACLSDEPMKNHTSFNIGGPVNAMIFPENERQCIDILNLCSENGIAMTVLGKGSNLLVSDDGIDGAVMSLEKLSGISHADKIFIKAGAGASMKDVAIYAMEAGLSGFEFAHGIPGSIGGGVYMNAGAYDSEMKKVVSSASYIDETGSIKTIEGDKLDFGYRKSFFTNRNYIITDVTLKLSLGDSSDIKNYMDELWQRRTKNQPLEYPSAGSVFKRPEGYFAGKLIRDSGLSGCSIGKAMVSPKHCGFIVNTGGATAKDVKALIHHIQKTVNRLFGVMLECEIKFAGKL